MVLTNLETKQFKLLQSEILLSKYCSNCTILFSILIFCIILYSIYSVNLCLSHMQSKSIYFNYFICKICKIFELTSCYSLSTVYVTQTHQLFILTNQKSFKCVYIVEQHSLFDHFQCKLKPINTSTLKPTLTRPGNKCNCFNLSMLTLFLSSLA